MKTYSAEERGIRMDAARYHLLTGRSMRAAAARAGVAQTTLKHWFLVETLDPVTMARQAATGVKAKCPQCGHRWLVPIKRLWRT